MEDQSKTIDIIDPLFRKPLLVSFLIIPGISCLAAAFLKVL